ncbi:hypothetical protein C6P40_002185 [Pichia californica]|uniref:NAD(P)-binding domain-containing protein n=1 Tax=Pichia californica TaxID=460514 RepID=A0A9P6WI00_9ASCO|nr:hypothetical protein C6P42_002233 [[Candida] californica]KAG0687549.1 hypothetical protein C6P40_002185 [[Candida] californica]
MKLFITGATGYVGGEVLFQFLEKFPNFEITALVRSIEKGKIIKDATNNKVQTVIGSLDSLDLIRNETESSDIIINAASNNHLPSLNVIKEVLSKKTKETLFLQISGAGVVTDGVDPSTYTPNKIYDDVKDIKEITLLPDSQPHRLADKLVLSIEETNPKFVKTAIISPPIIFGFGKGYDNILSVQIPILIKSIVKLGSSFTVYKGDTKWSHGHIYDVGTLFINVISKFINKEEFNSGVLGYYFTNDGIDYTFKEIAVRISNKLFELGLISSKLNRELTPTEINEKFNFPALFWGSNARTISNNGRKIGWEMTKSDDNSFFEDINLCVDYMNDHGLLK